MTLYHNKNLGGGKIEKKEKKEEQKLIKIKYKK
jgi:hypothetical protein